MVSSSLGLQKLLRYVDSQGAIIFEGYASILDAVVKRSGTIGDSTSFVLPTKIIRPVRGAIPHNPDHLEVPGVCSIQSYDEFH